MESLTPEQTLLEHLKNYANRSWGEESPVSYNELKNSINAVAVDRRCAILAKQFEICKTVLYTAARENDIDVFRLVIDSVSIESKFDLLKAEDANGETALHWMGQSELTNNIQYVITGLSQENVTKLLQIQNRSKETFLHTASQADTSAALEHLLSLVRPEDIFNLLKVQDDSGWTSLYYSVFGDNDPENKVRCILDALSPEQCVQLYELKTKNKETILHRTLRMRSLSKLKILLEHKNVSQECKACLLQTQDGYGFTLLHAVCFYKLLEAVKYILDGQPLHVRLQLLKSTSNKGETPLHVAAAMGGDKLFQPLLANIPPSEVAVLLSMQDKKGNTAVTCAVNRSLKGVVLAITELIPTEHVQTILNIPNNENKTAMQIAVAKNNQSAVKKLQKCMERVKRHSTEGSECGPDEQPWGSSFEAYTANDTSAEQLSGPPQDGTYEVTATSTNTTPHQFLPDILDPFNTDGCHRPSGSKRPAPSERFTQPASEAKSARVDQVTGRVKRQKLRMTYQGDCYKIRFKPENTVGQFIKRIEKATASSCTLKDQEEVQYTEDVTLDLLKSPFVISFDGVEVLVTGGTEKRNVASSSNQTETNQQKTFDRVRTVEEVVSFFSFVHEQMKKGKTINGALKLAKKNRKTIDRFVNIYYLHGQNREKLEELKESWTVKDKPGGLQELDAMAKKEINWDQLQQLFANGTVADFQLEKDRLEET